MGWERRYTAGGGSSNGGGAAASRRRRRQKRRASDQRLPQRWQERPPDGAVRGRRPAGVDDGVRGRGVVGWQRRVRSAADDSGSAAGGSKAVTNTLCKLRVNPLPDPRSWRVSDAASSGTPPATHNEIPVPKSVSRNGRRGTVSELRLGDQDNL